MSVKKVLCPLCALLLSVCCWFCCLLLLCHVSFKKTTTTTTHTQTPSSRRQGDTTLYSTLCSYELPTIQKSGREGGLCLPFFTMTLPTRKTTDTLLFYRVYITYIQKGVSVDPHTCCQSLMPAQYDDDTGWEWHFIYSELEVCWAFVLCFWFQFKIEYYIDHLNIIRFLHLQFSFCSLTFILFDLIHSFLIYK